MSQAPHIDQRRRRTQQSLALVVAVGFSALAVVVAPVCVGLVAASLVSPDLTGWLVLGAMLLPVAGLPFTHVAAQRVLVGSWPGWLLDTQRLLDLCIVGFGSAALLVLVLGHAIGPGIASLVWPAALVLYLKFGGWHDRGRSSRRSAEI